MFRELVSDGVQLRVQPDCESARKRCERSVISGRWIGRASWARRLAAGGGRRDVFQPRDAPQLADGVRAVYPVLKKRKNREHAAFGQKNPPFAQTAKGGASSRSGVEWRDARGLE